MNEVSPVAGSFASVPARKTGAGRHAGPCVPDLPWPGSALAPEAASAAVASPTVTSFMRRIPVPPGKWIAARKVGRIALGPYGNPLKEVMPLTGALRRAEGLAPEGCLSQQPPLGHSPFGNSPCPAAAHDAVCVTWLLDP